MKRIDLGGGQYMIGSAAGERGPHHREIVKTEACGCGSSAKRVTLSCGHIVQAVGDLRHAGGWIMCLQCAEGAHRDG
jgi:hypothetical protein